MHERIELTGKPTKQLVQPVDRTLVGEPLLDDALQRIASTKRRGSLSTWVTRLAGMKRLGHRLAEGLVRRGILRKRDEEVVARDGLGDAVKSAIEAAAAAMIITTSG